jgi:hypothetical protein
LTRINTFKYKNPNEFIRKTLTFPRWTNYQYRQFAMEKIRKCNWLINKEKSSRSHVGEK